MPLESSTSNESQEIVSLKEKLSKFETEEGRLKGLSYSPRQNDIVITTTPKAGTTWMQQICHQLRSNGDMTFGEISEVVPWLELAHDQGQNLEDSQYGHDSEMPRLFKTHAWEDHCPKFPKTIVVLRDPYDVVASFYKFFEDWFFNPGTISVETFAENFWLARGVPSNRMENASYFVHLVSWYKRKDDDNVLIVFFEDLKEDLASQVRRVAEFLSTDELRLDDDDRQRTAVEKSSYSFMKAHASHFDERLSKLARNEACGLSKSAGLAKSKINSGLVGQGLSLSESLKAKIDLKWSEVVEPAIGCSSYSELRTSGGSVQD